MLRSLVGSEMCIRDSNNDQIQVYKKIKDPERISAFQIKLVNEALILHVFKNPENEQQIKMTFQARFDYLKCKLEEIDHYNYTTTITM